MAIQIQNITFPEPRALFSIPTTHPRYHKYAPYQGSFILFTKQMRHLNERKLRDEKLNSNTILKTLKLLGTELSI